MKKFILSLFVLASFGFYVISQNSSNSSNNFIVQTPIDSPNNTNTTPKNSKSVAIIPTIPVVKKPPSNPPNDSNQNNQSPTPPVIISPPPKKVGLYNDGTYVGNSVDAYYGNVQVKAVISNGKLSDIVFLDYPRDRGHSIQINNYALPILKQEAIQSQSANVNTVSGATDSSGAFMDSLASALAQAKA